jgi:hypothetical protein
MPRFSRTWTDDQFINAVAASRTWAAVGIRLGLKTCKGEAISRLRGHATRLDVDVSHLPPFRAPRATRTCARLGCGRPFSGKKGQKFCSQDCHRAYRKAQVIDTWLRTGQPIRVDTPGSVIKHYLLKEQESRCAICRMANEWRGLELVFILDHIDGDASNNRRDNLRLICPNCDSQLETYKGRNAGNGRHARRERYAAGLSY